jgi:hypothetical protein
MRWHNILGSTPRDLIWTAIEIAKSKVEEDFTEDAEYGYII